MANKIAHIRFSNLRKKLLFVFLLVIFTGCTLPPETDKAQQNTKASQPKKGDIKTDFDAFWKAIESIDTDLKRDEYIKSLNGLQVAWRLYVYNVKEEVEWSSEKYTYEEIYRLSLSRYPDWPDVPAPSFETKDKEYALSFSKGDPVTYKGTFKTIIFKPDCENVSLIKGW